MRQTTKKEVRGYGSNHFARIAKGLVWSIGVASAWTFPLFPAVRINLDAANGQGIAWTSFAIGSIVFGAICVEIVVISLKSKKLGTAATYGLLATLFLTLNVMQSIGNAAGHSEDSRGDRSSQIEKKQRLARMRNQSQQARQAQFAIAADATPESIDADIKAAKSTDAKRWNATDGCNVAKITAGETRAFCSKIANLEAKHAAALKRDELDAKLAEIDKEDTGEAPASLDPYADNVARFLGMFGYSLNAENKVLITSVRDWGKAVGVELMAIFGPAGLMMIIGLMLAPKPEGEHKPVEAPKPAKAPKEPEDDKAAPVAVLAIPGDDEADAEMHSFVTRRLERCEGSEMKAGALFKFWQEDCSETGVPCGSPKGFSNRIRRYFEHSPNNGRPVYKNVQKKTSKPAIRMVVNN